MFLFRGDNRNFVVNLEKVQNLELQYLLSNSGDKFIKKRKVRARFYNNVNTDLYTFEDNNELALIFFNKLLSIINNNLIMIDSNEIKKGFANLENKKKGEKEKMILYRYDNNNVINLENVSHLAISPWFYHTNDGGVKTKWELLAAVPKETIVDNSIKLEQTILHSFDDKNSALEFFNNFLANLKKNNVTLIDGNEILDGIKNSINPTKKGEDE